MSHTKNHTGYTLITAILPKETAKKILDRALSVKISTNIIINARGTLYRDKWIQKFTSINPENTIFELLVPENLAPVIMDSISVAAGLHEGKRGAVFCVECNHAVFMKPGIFPETLTIEKISDTPINYKNHLTAIYCIIQKGMAEKVATSAIRAGSSEPTIIYGQGEGGLRDKLGLLRIAISPEKELIRLVVDHYDAEPVFEAMVKQGKLDTPGKGYIYLLPVKKGIINLAAVTTGSNELANRYQMIKAIDELKGNSAWRIQNESEKNNKRKFLTNLYRLICVVEKGKGDKLIKTAMQAGAPGASITYGLESGGVIQKQNSSLSVYHEKEIIELILRSDKFEPVLSAMIQSAKDDGNNEVYFYSQAMPKALTFTGE